MRRSPVVLISAVVLAVGAAVFAADTQKKSAGSSKWKILAPIPAPQLGCGSVVVGRKLHVLGGVTVTGRTDDGGFVYGASDTHQVYDPASNTWTAAAPLPDKAGWPAVASYQGKIYVFGGDRKGIDAKQSDRAFVYDPAADRWSELAHLPAARSYSAARTVGDAIYIFGARTLHSDTLDPSAYRYDPAADRYTRLADMPEGARFITQAEYNGFIYCIHGETVDETYADGVLKYDIKKNAWAKLNIARPNKTKWTLSQQSANIHTGATLFVLGGKPPDGNRTPMATYFDMAHEKFGMIDAMPAGRCCGVSGVIDGTIYAAGGFWELVHDVVECRETWGYRVPKTLLGGAEECCR